MRIKPWLPLIGLVLSVFIFNMSEFTPVGLLTNIATDLEVSESKAGMIISFYAWVVAIISLPMMLLFVKTEYKRTMLLMVALFSFFQFISGIASSYEMLMIGRIGVAVAHSVFWAIVTPMAIKSVDIGYQRLAISAIAAGTSIAMIFGIPLGRIIGLALGWRMAFMTIAIIGVFTFMMLLIVLPRMENPRTFTLKRLPDILTNKVLIGIYILTIVFVTGYYMGYSYIEPFLGQVAGMSDSTITLALTVIGVAGIMAGFLFARFYDAYRSTFMILSVGGSAACLFLIYSLTDMGPTILLVCLIWGLCTTTFVMTFQNETIRSSVSDGVMVATGLESGLFNLGIALGSMFGGMVLDDMGVEKVPLVGASIVFVSLLLLIAIVLPMIRARYAKDSSDKGI